MNDTRVVTARRLQGQVQCVRHILGPDVCAKLSGDDIAAGIVENRTEVEPAPSQNLDMSEVCLPKLVDGRRLVLELIGSLQEDEGRTGDQVIRFKCAIGSGIRHKVFFVCVRHRQLSRGQSCLFQGDDFALRSIRNTVPDMPCASNAFAGS